MFLFESICLYRSPTPTFLLLQKYTLIHRFKKFTNATWSVGLATIFCSAPFWYFFNGCGGGNPSSSIHLRTRAANTFQHANLFLAFARTPLARRDTTREANFTRSRPQQYKLYWESERSRRLELSAADCFIIANGECAARTPFETR